MRIRNLAIASIAVMVLSMPARADLILVFLDKGPGSPTNTTSDFIAYGNQPYDNGGGPVPALNPVTSIEMMAGETRIIQLALVDTVVGNTFPPLGVSPNPPSSIPPTGVYTAPRWLSTASGTALIPQMFGMTLWETRVTGTVIGPAANPTGGAFIAPPNAVPGIDPDFGNNRIALTNPNAAFINAGSMPPTFSDFGGLLATGNGAIPNRDYLNDANTPALGGRLVLFNFEITVPATSPLGTFPITVSDRSIFNDFEVRATGAGGVGVPGDRIALDSTIFSAAHPNYVLNVQVVPEPSSMALAGMALAGLGYKLRRKMKAKAQATA
jgi:hypothetical protein